MVFTTQPDAWTDTCLITIAKLNQGGTSVNIEANAMTETIDIAEPDYPGEGIPTLAGARVWKQSPQEDGEITVEFYPVQLATTANNLGLFEQYGGGTYTSSEPRQTDTSWGIGIDRTRDRFAVVIMWTNDNVSGSEPTSATDTTDTASDAARFVALSCRMISHKADFTDGMLKVTATFKFPAMDTTGAIRCYRWESVDQDPIGALFTNGDYDDEFSYT